MRLKGYGVRFDIYSISFKYLVYGFPTHTLYIYCWHLPVYIFAQKLPGFRRLIEMHGIWMAGSSSIAGSYVVAMVENR